MPEASTCPGEAVWMPLLAGEKLAPELQRHFDGCAACRKAVDRLRSELDNMRTLTESLILSPAAPVRRPGDLGRYVIVGELGTTIATRDYRALEIMRDTDVVVRLSRHSVRKDDLVRDRLLEEGKRLAEILHPHLVRVLDLDYFGDQPFLVVEYVHGVPLPSYVENRLPSAAVAARWVASLARAAVTMHQSSVWHLDIKPATVLIDDDASARLTDVGMTRLRQLGTEAFGSASVGSPAFMAPEQARGDTSLLGPATDQFALGALAFFLLTGRPPFTGKDLPTILSKARRCDVPADLLTKANAPKPLETVILRALSERPHQRFPSAADFAQALEASVGGVPTLTTTWFGQAWSTAR